MMLVITVPFPWMLCRWNILRMAAAITASLAWRSEIPMAATAQTYVLRDIGFRKENRHMRACRAFVPVRKTRRHWKCTSSLGDWFVNPEKIRCGLPKLVSEINALGLKFGIWIEPEMISMDSDLYRAHPEWMLAIPGRPPVSSRCQYVLDMTRKDVIDYLYNQFAKLLNSCNIEYVK